MFILRLRNLFSSFYTSEVEKTKTNKLIKGFGVVVFICAIGITFFTLKENYDGSNVTESVSVVKEKPKKLEIIVAGHVIMFIKRLAINLN